MLLSNDAEVLALRFDNPNSYTIRGTDARILFKNPGFSVDNQALQDKASIWLRRGTHTIEADIDIGRSIWIHLGNKSGTTEKLKIRGNISGVGVITVTGDNGALVELYGDNTFSDDLYVGSHLLGLPGFVRLKGGNNISGNVGLLNNESELDLNGTSEQIGSLYGGNTWGHGKVKLGGGTLTITAGIPSALDPSSHFLGAFTESGLLRIRMSDPSHILALREEYFSGVVSTASVEVDEGILSLFSGNIFGACVPVTVNEGGVLKVVDGAEAFGKLTLAGGTVVWDLDGGTLSPAKGITLSTGGGFFWVSSGLDIPLNATIGGEGSLVKNGSGILRLGGENNYMGETFINNGTLLLEGGDNLPATSTVTVRLANGEGFEYDGTLDLDGTDEQVRSLAGAGKVRLGGGTLSLANPAGESFKGSISESGAIRVDGSGHWNLQPSSSPTAPLYIKGTTVAASGATESMPVIIEQDGILESNGPINGVATEAGGILSPGEGPRTIGTLESDGPIIFHPGSILELTMGDMTVVTPPSWDQLHTTKRILFQGPEEAFQLQLVPVEAGFAFNFDQSGSWLIATADLGIQNFSSATISLDSSNVLDGTGHEFSTHLEGGQIFLDYAPIAIPQTLQTDEDQALEIAPTVAAAYASLPNLDYVVRQGPSHGTLMTTGSPSRFIYTPDQDFHGEDSFTFAAQRDGLVSRSTPIAITIDPVNDAPVARPDIAGVQIGKSVVIDVLDNDLDVDGNALSIIIEDAPLHGTATLENGQVRYTNTSTTSLDSFTYRATDNLGGESSTVEVTLVVVPQIIEVTVSDEAEDSENDTTLREAIALATLAEGKETILVPSVPPGTRTTDHHQLLRQGELVVDDPGGTILITTSEGTGTLDALDLSRHIKILNGSLILERIEFTRGSSSTGGGSIWNEAGLRLIACNFNGNQSTDSTSGGALLNTGTLSISRTLFEQNTSARHGGAIHMDGGTALIVNTTFSGNIAGDKGGAIKVETGEPTLNFCTLTLNHASNSGGGFSGKSGGMQNSDVSHLSHCIIAGNTSGNSSASPDDAEGKISDTSDHNLFSTNVSGIDTGLGNLKNTDPLLLPLERNGGSTRTHYFSGPSSPAIDAGDPQHPGWPLHDQRGVDFDRIVTSIPDIGAVEYDDRPRTRDSNGDPILAPPTEDMVYEGSLDADPNLGSDLTFALLKAMPSNEGVIEINATDGTFVFQPAADFNGETRFAYKVTAGGIEIRTEIHTIHVATVNDAPAFELSDTLTANEDFEDEMILSPFPLPIPSDETTQVVTYVLEPASVDFAEIVFDSSSGEIRFNAVPDAHGSQILTLTASDGQPENGSFSQSLQLTILPVNDPPRVVYTDPIQVLEDSGPQMIDGFISIGAPFEADQTLDIQIMNSAPELFSQQPEIDTSGQLLFTPAPDAFGTADVTFTLLDDGGTERGGLDSSGPVVVTILILPVNDAPSFTKGMDIEVPEDAGAQQLNGWATGFSPGPGEENDQILSLLVTAESPDLFSSGPTVDVEGNLTFTSAPNAYGSTLVSIRGHDGGDDLNGGVNSSMEETFMINITPVNDPPEISALLPGPGPFTAGAPLTITALASDIDGEIAQVEYRLQGTLEGTTMTSPHSLDWTAPLAGTYELVLEATDDVGLTAMSSPVSLDLLPAINLPRVSETGFFTMRFSGYQDQWYEVQRAETFGIWLSLVPPIQFQSTAENLSLDDVISGEAEKGFFRVVPIDPPVVP